MTDDQGYDERETFWSGASVFNTGGQRLNEIDLDEPRHGATIDEMSDEGWCAARAALRSFDAGKR
ncbi:hypothetical protein VA596_50520 [Amycolatopsis sp., V23-08]|uniref:Uncharacterized protein n=1 Tax=Amycolatopsis heterodermiae TaxID=3110235 RepID=A0ABU5RNQ5_9PSEU|nr:hypothetical protein [Amycolatopsis sp., V23-08]MEA5367848.1 hypothetical protein [Amycolatopsis sp., V23-08]